jgi:hypothetical protein
MELVAFLGKDRESWGQISALMKKEKWDKVVIIKNKDAEDDPFEIDDKIKVNSDLPLLLLKDELLKTLKEKLSGDFEVALSIASGNGKEHMALISALLSIPVGIRLVAYTKDGVEYIN